MKQKLLIILSVIFSAQTSASEYNITDQCQVFMLEREVEPSSIVIDDEEGFYVPIFRRNGTEEIFLETVSFGIPQFEGMYASYKGESIVHCWPAFSYVTGVLVEKNEYFYEPIGNKVVDAYKIHLHIHVYSGPGALASKIETIYFVDRDYNTLYLKEIFIGDTHEYPSPWFKNYLTLEEANEFIKYYEFDSFEWHGQMYDVK